MKIIITGTSRGIGRQLYNLALAENHQVLALTTNENFRDSQKPNSPAHIIQGDLRDDTTFEKVSMFVKSNWESNVDILINNAGILYKEEFHEIQKSSIQEMIETNFTGALNMIQCVSPYMKTSKIKHIVNIGSMGGFQGSDKFPGLSVYSASKAALSCLSECLATEFSNSHGVRINCLALGSVNTEMLKEAFPGFVSPTEAEEMARFIMDFGIHGWKTFNGKTLPVSGISK